MPEWCADNDAETIAQCNDEHPHYATEAELRGALTEHGVYAALKLDGCPCFTVHIALGPRIEGHCWRTGPKDIEGCTFTWFDGRLDPDTVAHLVAELDRMDWYGPWTVVAAS